MSERVTPPDGDATTRAIDSRPRAPARKPTRLRAGLLCAIGVFYVLSVPWYREADPAPGLWLGVPSWVAVAVGCYFAAACLNAVAWWVAPFSDELPAAGDDPSEEAR